MLRVDNMPAFISLKLATWGEEHDIKLGFIKPGKLTPGSYIERFNRSYRNEALDLYGFHRLSEV